jgi:small subunit ribosomal protein S4
MIKKHKRYARPRKPFERARIEEEKSLISKYGLRSKKEIWKAEFFINRIRSQAKKLIVHPEQQEAFLARLVGMGFIQPGAGIDDVLALTRENLFERRLQTIVFKRGLTTTVKQARQYVVHRKVKMGNRIVDIPGCVVKKAEEDKISVIKKEKKEKPKEKAEEAVPEANE